MSAMIERMTLEPGVIIQTPSVTKTTLSVSTFFQWLQWLQYTYLYPPSYNDYNVQIRLAPVICHGEKLDTGQWNVKDTILV